MGTVSPLNTQSTLSRQDTVSSHHGVSSLLSTLPGPYSRVYSRGHHAGHSEIIPASRSVSRKASHAGSGRLSHPGSDMAVTVSGCTTPSPSRRYRSPGATSGGADELHVKEAVAVAHQMILDHQALVEANKVRCGLGWRKVGQRQPAA